jgi:carboxypeptidase T
MMKKLALALLLPVLWSAAAAANGNPAAPEKAGSFSQLINASAASFVRPAGGPSAASMPALDLPEPVSASTPFSYLLGDDRYWIAVRASDKYARTKLLEAGLDIVEITDSGVLGFARKADADNIAALGFTVESRVTIYEYAKQRMKDFPASDAAYHNYAETAALLQDLAAKNPEVASLFSAGKTVEGRDIWCLRLNSKEKGGEPSARPGAFYVGNHHAREHLTNEVALGLAGYLLDNKNTPEVKKYLDTLDIYIIPMLNADGAEYDIATGSYRWHRKNTRINADKSIGVDLNRNYDSLWCQAGASHSPGSDTYCGPSAFSEPETLAVKQFVETRKNIRTLMSYHSYSSLLLYPWAGKDTPLENVKDRTVFEKMAKAMTAFTGYKPEQSSDLYVATGDTTDWAYATAGIFAFTTELEGSSFYPGAAIISKAVTNNVKAAVFMLSVTDNPYKLAE